MYLSALMLTGQGGPDGDLPWYTKSVILMTGIFSIGMFAIPASMLTWGFEAEAQRVAKLSYFHRKATPVDLPSSASRSRSRSGSGSRSGDAAIVARFGLAL